MKNYIVNLGDGTYYSKYVFWKGVTKEKATWFTHKDALKIASRLKQPRIGFSASTEEK